MKTLIWYFLAFLGGAAYALGAPSLPHIYHPLWAVSGVSIFLASLSFFAPYPPPHPLRHDLLVWALFSLGLYLAGFSWIPHTMQEFGGIRPILSYILGLLTAFILVPQVLGFILLFHLCKKLGWGRARFKNQSFYFLLGALVWLLLENFVPQQFPYHLGHSFLRIAPYLAPATIGGEPLYSGAAIWLALSIAYFIRQRRFDPWPWGASIILLLFSFLNPLSNPYQQAQDGTPINLRIVQGSIGNDLKNRSERGDLKAIQEVNRIYYELSTAPAEQKLDLIIWPETAINQPFNTRLLMEAPIINLPYVVDRTMHETQTALFTGAYDIYDFQQFNSALYFTYQAQQANPINQNEKNNPARNPTPAGKITFAGYYHKMKLLTFGETLPFGPLNKHFYRWLGDLVSNFTPGTEMPVFSFPLASDATKDASFHRSTPAPSFVPNICYEILLTSWQRRYLQKLDRSPNLMINLTNDSWFGRTAEPEQHLFLGKWRAIEFQKAIVRSTNSGISTIIYPNGETSKRLEVDVRGNLDQTIYLHPAQPTIYQRYGLWAVLGIGVLLLILIKLGAVAPRSNWQIKTKFKF